MMRIALFLLTNLAVIVVASITLSLLGVNSYLAQSGTGLDLGNLLIFSAVFGFAGSFISLLISKPMAKWSTRAQIIKQPSNSGEKWLLDTVRELSEKAGIGMPEVGVFPAQQSNAFATGWNKNDALVAVSQGPGSFTGLRVGIAFAKTLAWAVECQLVAVDTFEAIAAETAIDGDALWVVSDAHRNELYVRHFLRQNDGTWQQIT